MTPHDGIVPLRDEQAEVERRRGAVRQAALDHMVAAVTSTVVYEQPFPHFTVQALFPAELYRDILAGLPAARHYEAFSYDKHKTDGQSNRGRFALTARKLDLLPPQQRGLWLGVRDALGAPAFKNAVFGRLARGLAYRFGVSADEAAGIPGYPLPELFRETSGYTIKPHPDTRRKLVTMQVALPADGSQSELGTEFHRRSWSPLALLREPRGFEIVKRPPFLPNAAYAFAVINTLALKSWHGRSTLAAVSGVRNSILNIWYAQAEDASAELVEHFYKAA